MTPFPKSPAELSTTWLSDVLGHPIQDFRVERLGEGAGLMGLITRVDLVAESEPASLVVKFSSPAPENRVVAATYDMYRREVEFYNELADRVPIRTPACYFAGFDPSNQDCILVLEDLGTSRIGDQVAGCSLEEARAILSAIAGLHASTWQAVDLDHVWLQNNPIQIEGMVAGFQAGWPACNELFPEVIPESAKGIDERYPERVASLLEEMCRAPICLIHSDLRLDNVFFGEEGQEPSAPGFEIALIDWQAVSRSAPEQDVAYFLTQSVPQSVRDEEDLVATYHSELVRRGIDYSLSDCRRRYETSALYLLSYAVVTAGTLDPGNERGVALARTILGGALSVLDELDAFRRIG